MTICNCPNSFLNLKWVNFIIHELYLNNAVGGGVWYFFFLALLAIFLFIVGILQFYHHILSKISFYLNSYLVYLVLPVPVDLYLLWKILRHYHVDHFPQCHLEIPCLKMYVWLFLSSSVSMSLNLSFIFSISKSLSTTLGYFMFFFLFFLDREGKGGRKRGRDTLVWETSKLLIHAPTGNLGMCPDRDSNPATFCLAGQYSNQLSHTA